jgi:alkylation response protein AidB-like acyl-CoA dehydrogenase
MTTRAESPSGEPLGEFRLAVAAELARRLKPKREDAMPRLYGIRDNEDLREAGRQFLVTMANLGWATPHWPRKFGGPGFSAAEATVLSEELGRFDMPDLYPYDVSLRMVASVLMKFGSEAQQERWMEKIRLGEEIWCQLFSEPGAGSDLAGVTCRAVRDDDGWLLSGRKTWSSRAIYARWGLLLARSDATMERHRGLTAFALDMRSDGVNVQPIKQMNGDAHFAEVLLENVRVPDECRLGEVNGGWTVAMTTLANERAGLRTAGLGLRSRDVLRLLLDRPLDPVLRHEVIQAFIELEVAQLTSARVASAMVRGATPGPEGSGSKLRTASAMRRIADVALRVLGAEGMLDESFWSALALSVPSMSVRGGTDQIQRNIIGERVLGLPKEPSAEKKAPSSTPRRG